MLFNEYLRNLFRKWNEDESLMWMKKKCENWRRGEKKMAQGSENEEGVGKGKDEYK